MDCEALRKDIQDLRTTGSNAEAALKTAASTGLLSNGIKKFLSRNTSEKYLEKYRESFLEKYPYLIKYRKRLLESTGNNEINGIIADPNRSTVIILKGGQNSLVMDVGVERPKKQEVDLAWFSTPIRGNRLADDKEIIIQKSNKKNINILRIFERGVVSETIDINAAEIPFESKFVMLDESNLLAINRNKIQEIKKEGERWQLGKKINGLKETDTITEVVDQGNNSILVEQGGAVYYATKEDGTWKTTRVSNRLEDTNPKTIFKGSYVEYDKSKNKIIEYELDDKGKEIGCSEQSIVVKQPPERIIKISNTEVALVIHDDTETIQICKKTREGWGTVFKFKTPDITNVEQIISVDDGKYVVYYKSDKETKVEEVCIDRGKSQVTNYINKLCREEQ